MSVQVIQIADQIWETVEHKHRIFNSIHMLHEEDFGNKLVDQLTEKQAELEMFGKVYIDKLRDNTPTPFWMKSKEALAKEMLKDILRLADQRMEIVRQIEALQTGDFANQYDEKK